MNAQIFSLTRVLTLLVVLAGLPRVSSAKSSDYIYVNGSITMSDQTHLKVFIEANIDSSGAFGNIGMVGPDGKVVAYVDAGQFTSATTATLNGSLNFTFKVNGKTYSIPASVTVDMTKSGAVQTLGWLVVSTDTSNNSPYPYGTVLWSSGLNRDGSIYELDVKGPFLLEEN